MFWGYAMGELIWTGDWKPHSTVGRGCHVELYILRHRICGGTRAGKWGVGVIIRLPVDQTEFTACPKWEVINIIYYILSSPTLKFNTEFYQQETQVVNFHPKLLSAWGFHPH